MRLLDRIPHLRGSRPILIDLCCKAGGASMGYHRAGFRVVGVDWKRQPRYPFPFIQADMMDLTPEDFEGAAAVAASPPCQGYTEIRHAPGTVGAPRLIGPVERLLVATDLPYIIENVAGAAEDMPGALTLCGSMFGLGAQGCQLQRHRLFLSNIPLEAPRACRHRAPAIGVYGGHARLRSAKHGGRGTRDVWAGGHKAAAARAMGIDWMTLGELSEAIPPAYTRHLGQILLAHLADLGSGR